MKYKRQIWKINYLIKIIILMIIKNSISSICLNLSKFIYKNFLLILMILISLIREEFIKC